jgi:hypothetical protein
VNESLEDQVVLGLARAQVSQLAPQELPLFRAQSSAYLRDPNQALESPRARGDLLGFGGEAAVVFLTPVILDVSRAALTFVVAEVRKSLREESPELIRQAVRSLFKRFLPTEDKPNAGPAHPPAESAASSTGAPPPGGSGSAPGTVAGLALSPEQLRELRRTAYERAKQLNLADDRAALLADSLVGSLVTA